MAGTALWKGLWSTETPLIITILLAGAAAYLSPMVTEQFERQRMRSEYVLANLRELNTIIAEVYVQVTAINYAVAAGEEAPAANVTQARAEIAKLNWKTVETAAMLPQSQRRVLHRFQADVRDVSRTLDGTLDVYGCAQLLQEVSEMGLSGALAIQAVGRHAELGESPPVEAKGVPQEGKLSPMRN